MTFLPEKPIKAVIYARVSTDEQHRENQIPVLETWAKARGWELVRTYQEDASAWKDGHQKELARLIEDARHGEFKLVIIWDLDRLTRGGPRAIFPLLDKLSSYKVRVFSYQQHWTEQPEGPMYNLLISVYSWAAEDESRKRSERTKIGMIRAKEKGTKSGKAIGRPRKN